MGPVPHALRVYRRSVSLALCKQGADTVHRHAGTLWRMAEYTVCVSYGYCKIRCNGFAGAILKYGGPTTVGQWVLNTDKQQFDDTITSEDALSGNSRLQVYGKRGYYRSMSAYKTRHIQGRRGLGSFW